MSPPSPVQRRLGARLRGVVLVGLLLAGAPAAAERRPFQVLGVADGLAQSQVLDLLEIDDGSLWVGTLGGGVSIWDGVSFRNLDRRSGLRSDRIRALAQHPDGSIWLGSLEDGVDVWRAGSFHRVPGTEGLRVDGFLETTSGRWLVATSGGVLEGDAADLQRIGPEKAVFSLHEAADGTLLVGTGDGLARLEGEALVPEPRSFEGRVLILAEGEHLWAGGKSGLWRRVQGAWSRVAGIESEVWDVRVSGNEVWVAAQDGLYLLDLRGGEDAATGESPGEAERSEPFLRRFGREEGLPVDRMASLTFDRDGGLWVGSWGGGLARLPAARLSAWGMADGLGSDLVLSFLRATDGSLWMGTYEGGLSRLRDGEVTTWGRSDGLEVPTIPALAELDGDLWLGTNGGGLVRFDGESFRVWTSAEGLAADRVHALLPASAGRLWVATYGGGIQLWEENEPVLKVDTSVGLSDDRVFSLAEDGEGGLWVGTQAGVNRVHADGSVEDFSSSPGWPGGWVLALETEPSGGLWLGTFGEGLVYVTSRGEVLRPGELASLGEDSVVSLERQDGILWVGTPRGLARIELAPWHEDGQLVVRSYGMAEGLLTVECNQNALLAEEDGRVWIGTVGGAWALESSGDSDPRVAPIARVAGVSASLRDVAPTEDALVVPWRSRESWTFDVAAVSLSAADQVRVRVRLVGLDERWSQAHRVQPVTYSNLAPGTYRFEVQAGRPPGEWGEKAVFDLELRAPYWKRPWFQGLFLGALFLGLWAVGRWRTRFLRTERKRLEDQVTRRTKDLVRARDHLEHVNEELLQARDDLEERVGDRTRALSSSVRRLKAEVAQRRQAELDLVEEKERLRVTFASLAEGVIALNSRGRVRLVNAVAERWLGCSASEALDRRLDEVLDLQIEDRPAFDPTVDGTWTGTVGAEGVRTEVRVTSAPISDEAGHAYGRVVVLRDVSTRRRLESEMLRSRNLRSLGLLAGGVAHDFNNLLTVLVGHLDFAREIAPEATEHLDQARQACAEAEGLARLLLAFSRRASQPLEHVAIATVVEETARFVLAGSSIRLHLDIGPDLPTLEVDRTLLSQALANLLQNAAEALGGEGEIEVRVHEVDLGRDAPSPLTPGRAVRIEIVDQGPGIAPEDLPRVFDPFFSRSEEGQGLGLAIAHSVVRRHRGHLSLDSSLGMGTVASVLLPLPDDEKAGEAGTGEIVVEVAPGRALVMDDEAAVRDLVRAHLEARGWSVEVAEDGAEAAKTVASAERFDVLFLDLTVRGGAGGSAALKAIRAKGCEAPAIVVSGYSDDAEMLDPRRFGFDAALAKPFEAKDLEDVMRRVLGRR